MSDFIHIVCPYCKGTNRLPEDKLSNTAKCGRCKEQLFDTKPISLTTDNISQHLEKNDIPVLIDFWAPWCGPCKMMAPNFEEAAKNFQTKVRFAKVNTEDQQSLGAHFNIRSIPTLILFKQGREIDRISGALDASALTDWLKGRV